MLRSGLRRRSVQQWPAFRSLLQAYSLRLSIRHYHGPEKAAASDWPGVRRTNSNEGFHALPKTMALARGLEPTVTFGKFEMTRQQLQAASVERPPTLDVLIAKRHAVPPRAQHFLEPPRQPILEKILDVFAEKSRAEPLWILPAAHSEDGAKTHGIVRMTQERRLKSAFQRALKIHGYDKAGRRIKTPSPSAATGPASAYRSARDPDELYGMVRLKCQAVSVVDFPADDMVAYFVQIIKKLKESLGRNDGEHHRQPTGRLNAHGTRERHQQSTARAEAHQTRRRPQQSTGRAEARRQPQWSSF